ncbi:Bestrophin, RFP-TM, chloride channel-domain-containing protein [Pilaira anomala]|nr:Bestrophin, RFP-TM, chloride channel-domain-containing protein [Pilaira anomala]
MSREKFMLKHDLRPSNFSRRWIRKLKQYPDHLRLRGSVLPSILPLVLLTGVYAYFIGVMYITWGWTHVALSNSIVPVLSVVLGLLLAFRANTSYARYYEGRQLWQDLASNTRNLARLIWCSIPERTQNDHLEKMRCMKLLLAFAVATKHYLRREYGIDYYDLDYLLPPHWVPAAASDDNKAYIVKDYFGYSSSSSSSSSSEGGNTKEQEAEKSHHLLDASQGGDDIHDLGNQQCQDGDDIHDLGNQQCPTSSHTPVPSSSNTSTLDGVVQSPTALLDNSCSTTIDKKEKKNKRRRRKRSTIKFKTEEDLPDEGNSDMSLPLEIIFRMSLYMAQAKTNGKVDGIFTNVIITHLNNLNDCLAGMERIVNTPIPAAYVVHLKQSLTLYILAIPFTLVSQLEWWIVPTMILASFILFGIDAIGSQIANPFGYNTNDLPLNTFCDSLRKEIEFIVYHLPCETENAMVI